MNGELSRQPVDTLRGVGPKLAQRLQRLGIHSIQDLLFHLPSSYQDRTRIIPIGELTPGTEALIEGTIASSEIAMGRRRSLLCRLEDDSGTLSLRFFYFNAHQQRQLQPGVRLRCFGEVRRGGTGSEIYHAQYQRIDDRGADLPQSLTPGYPTTEGISQTLWRKLLAQALAAINGSTPPPELLPACWAPGALSLVDALRYLHAPPLDADQHRLQRGQHPAQQRLALEELVAHHLALLDLRQRSRCRSAPPLPPNAALRARLLASLNFELTAAQRRAVGEIAADLTSNRPMMRLLQGDVGSGKTLVAALAALQAAGAGYQVALMAPTEILAEQHWHSFEQWFAALGVTQARLLGRVKGKARAAQLELIRSGEAAIAIGTHALFQEDVSFSRLGLVIVDEQHRFGVHQRLLLRDKGRQTPHQLTMTATPIPRTLAMTAYADLDCSVIDELPPGRSPVITAAVPNGRRAEVIERVRAAASAGHQAYWVCTLIEESDQLQAQAAEAIAAELAVALPGIAVGLVHGRQHSAAKSATMSAFKDGRIAVLVATTVIEVGVDVPNASLMVIENPERLGLAQLHQLRGRVGRGGTQSHCVLLYQSPLSRAGKARLQAMRESNDGFYIAQRDLELRGPGEVLGTRQTGVLEFRVADLLRDQSLIDDVRRIAERILSEQPQLVEPLLERWLRNGRRFAEV